MSVGPPAVNGMIRRTVRAGHVFAPARMVMAALMPAAIPRILRRVNCFRFTSCERFISSPFVFVLPGSASAGRRPGAILVVSCRDLLLDVALAVLRIHILDHRET